MQRAYSHMRTRLRGERPAMLKPPVHAASSVIGLRNHPLPLLVSADRECSSRCRVVIIGSGVAGSLIAWRLAEAKLKVLILDAGPRIDRVEAFKSIWPPEIRTPALPIRRPPTPSPTVQRLERLLHQHRPRPFRGMYTRGVGGSTWHWAGSVLRYRPSDFRMKSRFGVGIDWPISYEELAHEAAVHRRKS